MRKLNLCNNKGSYLNVKADLVFYLETEASKGQGTAFSYPLWHLAQYHFFQGAL